MKKKIIPIPKHPTFEDVQALRMYVRAREDFQSMRVRLDNRIGRKANGEEQDIDERKWISDTDDLANFSSIAGVAHDQEEIIQAMVLAKLQKFPIYVEYLKHVKGLKEGIAGGIIGEFNIHIATTVSKMVQFSGLNSGLVRGMKDILKSAYKKDMGDLVREYTTPKGVKHVIIRTRDMIPGDKLTSGYLSPFNKRLRRLLIGILAPSFIKCQAPYAMDHYYPLHVPVDRRKELGWGRLDKSDEICERTGKKWRDESEGHRSNYAKRKMIKAFLADLYNAWRAIEGLPVRPPYAEEYLGKKHGA